MTDLEFNLAMARLDLNPEQAARLLGFKERMGRYYASGDHPVPATLAALLRVMVKKKITPSELESLVA